MDEKCEDLIEITMPPTGRITYVKFSRVVGAEGTVSYRTIYKEELKDGSVYDYTASVQLKQKTDG